MEGLEFDPRFPFAHLRRSHLDSNPLFSAVLADDLIELKRLLEGAGKSPNSKNLRGHLLLNYAVDLERVAIFDYLLTLPELDVELVDDFGRTPFLHAASASSNEYYALKLLDRGADLHKTDYAGYTVLHMAARSEAANLKIGRLVLERGADVNAQSRYGATPLYTACVEGNFEWVHLLLYYGALATIPSPQGILPLAVLSRRSPEDDHASLLETLFEHTFDGENVTVRLSTLVEAMTQDSPLFPRLVRTVSKVDYDVADLRYLCTVLIDLKPGHFEVFLDKFGYIVREMIDIFSPLTLLITQGLDLKMAKVKDIFTLLVESDYVADFVQNSNPTQPTVGRVIQMFNKVPKMFVEEERVTKMVCLMLSHGLTVTSVDLEVAYAYYRFSDLFKILLHMEVKMVNVGKNGYSMAVLYYDPTSKIDCLFNEMSLSLDLLSFYNHPRLKELCSSDKVSDKIKLKAKNLPPVPSLVELSRNAAREFIVERFGVKNSGQFYTVLKRLPIGEMTKKVIALEKQLY